jgi:hypothetical protein
VVRLEGATDGSGSGRAVVSGPRRCGGESEGGALRLRPLSQNDEPGPQKIVISFTLAIVEGELGQIKRVDPRSYWKNEAHDFTPWLRENIEHLASALGLELDPFVDSEVPVGPFSADLVATDLASGAIVLVENQLEQTDHSHLGQLITYASGLNATEVIWVAPVFRDQHRQALTWLNENTVEDVRFFGVEIELLQIGDSPLAPNFKIAVAPSEWQKAVQASKSGGTSERNQRYREFWGQMLTELLTRDPQFTSSKPENAPRGNWMAFSLGRKGFTTNPSFGWEHGDGYVVRAEVYIDLGDKEQTKLAFDLLEAQKDAIETDFGGELVWARRDDIRASRIIVAIPGGIDDAPNDLEQYRDWLIERLFALRKTFATRVKALDL